MYKSTFFGYTGGLTGVDIFFNEEGLFDKREFGQGFEGFAGFLIKIANIVTTPIGYACLAIHSFFQFVISVGQYIVSKSDYESEQHRDDVIWSFKNMIGEAVFVFLSPFIEAADLIVGLGTTIGNLFNDESSNSSALMY